jgi:haloalkane dehalogenase
MRNIIRTPEDRFTSIKDFNFTANYLEVAPNLRMHYVDEGEKENPVVLLLHGEPSWSYLYRKMIPILSEAGFRVIAPDLIGFGKSDKPTAQSDYTFQKHLDWTTALLNQLDLKDITLFCQDWGGLIGLRLVAAMPDKFARVVASNTGLPIGKGSMPEAFLQWREFSQKSPAFNVGKVIQGGTLTTLSDEVIAAYNAPFPTPEYEAGARIFPSLVPIIEGEPEAINNMKAWGVLKEFTKPFLTIFGDSDPITFGGEKIFQKLIPGCKGQKHTILNASHFIQEEKGEELAGLIIEFCEEN